MSEYEREMYEELYAIRSRIDSIAEIYKEAYAIRSTLEKIEELLREIKTSLEHQETGEKRPSTRGSMF